MGRFMRGLLIVESTVRLLELWLDAKNWCSCGCGRDEGGEVAGFYLGRDGQWQCMTVPGQVAPRGALPRTGEPDCVGIDELTARD